METLLGVLAFKGGLNPTRRIIPHCHRTPLSNLSKSSNEGLVYLPLMETHDTTLILG